jgi:hypothetical protein
MKRLLLHNNYYLTKTLHLLLEHSFYVPKRIFSRWKEFNLDKSAALDIKQNFFSKIFVFNQRNNPEMPFSIININREWLERARREINRD